MKGLNKKSSPLKYYWNRYKSRIYSNCTDPDARRNSVYYWQNHLFAISAIYLIPFSLIAVIPGLYMAYITDLKLLLAICVLAIGSIITVAFVPEVSVFSRKLIFNGMLYLIAVALLNYPGATGPGLLYLLAITIFVLLSLDRVYGWLALVLNTFICTYFSFAIYYGFAGNAIQTEYQLNVWIAISSNLVFLSATAVFLIPRLFQGLQSTFDDQERLKKELEESIDELDEKNEELEQFAYIVSHDLKEPLRMISSFMELLEKEYRDRLDDQAKKYIHFAVDGAGRMGERINDLLEYSRIGRKYTTMEEVQLNQVVEEVKTYLEAEINKKDAKIITSELPALRAVSVAMQMLFQNLVSNALKYQPQKNRPVIEINAEEKETCWEFSISDNGIGISKDYHQQIFSVFERLHTPEEYPGSGMGLAICKKIAEQHGGKIWVESTEGKGSTFYFTIAKNL